MHVARRAPARGLAPFLARAALLVAGVAIAGAASAGEPDVERARDAHDRGVRAHAAGAAAKAFAEVDALAPTPASLEEALEAAMRADDAVLGAELLERSESRPERTETLSRTIDAARRRFAGRTGTIRVDCNGAARCLFEVDGRPAEGTRPVLTTVGPHLVKVERDGEQLERLVDVSAGAVVVVGGPEPPPTWDPTILSAPEKPSRSGISPVWFFVGLGATVLAGTAATISGLDALGKHDDFVGAGCAPGATIPKAPDCNARSDEGAAATLRTNLLIGLTGLFALNTAVLGAVFVRWSSAPSGNGGVATVGGSWR